MANVGVGDIAANPDGTERSQAVAWSQPKKNAVFSINSGTRFDDIRDGTSNTAAISEIRKCAGNDMRGNPWVTDICFYSHDRTPNAATPDHTRNVYSVISCPDAPCDGIISGNKPEEVILTARAPIPAASIRFWPTAACGSWARTSILPRGRTSACQTTDTRWTRFDSGREIPCCRQIAVFWQGCSVGASSVLWPFRCSPAAAALAVQSGRRSAGK